MSRHLHIDPVTGVSGDMLLGALIDLGAPIDAVRADLQALDIPGWELDAERVVRHGLTGTLATVRTRDTAHHRHASELIRIISSAGLRPVVAERASAIIRRIAEVEAAIHSIPVEEVHLHEVGALDTVVDVVGVCSALAHLDVTTVSCSPLPTGSGTVVTDHGELPVPAPATLALIAGTDLEWRFSDEPMELVTPTGAALVAALARPHHGVSMTVDAIGYGFGRSTRLPRANCCRVTLGATHAAATATGTPGAAARVVMLATNVDDQSPESLAVAVQACLDGGALDAWTTPVVMKKGRLGAQITVLCTPEHEAHLVDLLFTSTTTLGIRRETIERHVADRHEQVVHVDGHEIRVKVRRRGDRVLGVKPELDDCAAAARALGVSVDEIRERAVARLDGAVPAGPPPTG